MKTVDIWFEKNQKWCLTLEVPEGYDSNDIKELFYRFLYEERDKLPCNYITESLEEEEFLLDSIDEV